MQLCRVRKNFRYMDCTYKNRHCTWYITSTWYIPNQGDPWESDTKLDDEYLVPIPVQFSTTSIS